VDVEPPAQPHRVDAELARVRAHVAERDLPRLLHGVAELAGEHEAVLLLGSSKPRRLDEQDVAAGPGDGQSGGDAGDARALGRLEE